MGKTSSTKLISLFGILFFLAPLLALVVVIPNFANEIIRVDVGEVVWATRNTLLQSFGSFVLLLVGSFFGGLGLLIIHPFGRMGWVRPFVAFPYFVPPMFAVLAGFQLYPDMPKGWIGISILHAWINIGMGSVITERFLRRNFNQDRDVFMAFGLTKSSYILKVVLPQCAPLVGILLLGFLPLFFTSFTIPLILGGSTATTIEILIYEKFRLSQDWSIPVVLSLLQILIMGSLMWSLRLKNKAFSEDNHTNNYFMGWLSLRFGLLFLSVITFLFAGSFIQSFISTSPGMVVATVINLVPIIYNSVFLIIAASFLFFTGFSILCFYRPKKLLDFLTVFNSPGSALVAFSFIILSLWVSYFANISLVWSLLIIFFPILFRAFVFGPLIELQNQILTAQIYGAGNRLIFREIIYPQIRKSMVLGTSVAGLWVLGDFSVARMLTSSDQYLGLLAGSLMGSYRLEQSGWVCILILLIGLGNYIFLEILSRCFIGKFRVGK